MININHLSTMLTPKLERTVDILAEGDREIIQCFLLEVAASYEKAEHAAEAIWRMETADLIQSEDQDSTASRSEAV